MQQLITRNPQVSYDELIAQLIPPPTFISANFDNYIPDQNQPSQLAALKDVIQFAKKISSRNDRKKFFRKKNSKGQGIYLDGGFGVGKTHLLAAIYESISGPKIFLSYVELTNLVGAIGFASTLVKLSKIKLICIDEFELDDPGDTMMVSKLLVELTNSGVNVAVTSNTLPDQLGTGRFAAQDFLREINALADIFTVIQIDGSDYRHREISDQVLNLTIEDLRLLVADTPNATLDKFDELCEHLAKIHPSRYKKLLENVNLIVIINAAVIQDQAIALRLVTFVDRAYDAGIPIAIHGVNIASIFSPDMLAGGYRKKYLRSISRLYSLTGLVTELAMGTR